MVYFLFLGTVQVLNFQKISKRCKILSCNFEGLQESLDHVSIEWNLKQRSAFYAGKVHQQELNLIKVVAIRSNMSRVANVVSGQFGMFYSIYKCLCDICQLEINIDKT